MMKFPLLPLATAALCSLTLAAGPRTPQSVADELLGADRAFSTASADTDAVTGLSSMFAEDVTVQSAGRALHAKAAVLDTLRANPGNLKTRLRWTPARAGVSADGEHGFTFGYMQAERDGLVEPMKYLAYWVKGSAGWRVAVYKRVRAAGTTPPVAMMPSLLPAALVAPVRDEARLASHRASLDRAERAFSAEAQRIGLGPAFEKYGAADAINLGGPNVPAFVVGNQAIGAYIATNSPGSVSPVSWAPERVIVASSGDLGVTIGTITRTTADAVDRPRATPFFTVWRRARPADPWKYIAE